MLRLLLLSLITPLALACVAAPPPLPEALVLTPVSTEERAMHTRLYQTDDEPAVLAACVAVLIAHGFAAEAQDHELGVIVGVKDTHAGRERARLRASLATRLAGEFGLQTQLRITLQRLAYDARGREILREAVREPGEYAGFFKEVEQQLALASPQSGAQ